MMNVPQMTDTLYYGDELRWFVGNVININDPLQLGRVQVRIFGIHSENLIDIPQSELPWAQTVSPVTEGGSSGIGKTLGIKPKAQVFGIFLDSKNSQLPLVLGSIPKIENESQKATQLKVGSESLFVPDQSTKRQFGDLSINSIPANEVDDTYLAGETRVEKAYNFFISPDGGEFKPYQAAGIIGNFLQESGTAGDLNPRALNRSEGSFGIAQWNPAAAAGNRLGSLYDFASSRNLSPNSLYTQLLFTKYELFSTPYLGLGELRDSRNAEEASLVFEKKFERPAHGSTASRAQYANEVFEKMEGIAV